MAEERRRQLEREQILQQQVNDLWRTIPAQGKDKLKLDEAHFPKEPQENLLYFIEKNAPLLEPWQREVVRIVRKVSQYMYPQRQTKVMNEGWACFWHFTILHQLYAEGLVTDGFMIEFLQHHTNVVFQPAYDSPYYNGINPYTLGYCMMQDIKRICEHPTDEDRMWFPDFAGTPWLDTLHFAMRNFKDESFILQFLSPQVIRDLKLFSVLDEEANDYLEISAIHDEHGYQRIREALAANYNLGNLEPNIQVYNVDIRGDRSLTLRHDMHNGRPLDRTSAEEVLRHIHQLWGFDVKLESVHLGEIKDRYSIEKQSPGG
jgi:spore cortex formation protein SpoVR/YcgB (stage V sporulation)